jgi:hypothetical protein
VARHRPALHGEPRRASCSRGGTAAWSSSGWAVAGRGRALHGAERRRARHRERGHLQRGRPAGVLWTSCGRCALPLRPVRHPAHRRSRAPRLQGHRLPRRTGSTPRSRACAPRSRGCSAEAQEGDGEPGRRGRCCASRTAGSACSPRSTCCARPGCRGSCRTGRFTRGARRRRARLPGRARLRPRRPGPGRADGPTGMIGGESLAGPGPPGARRGGRRGASRPSRSSCAAGTCAARRRHPEIWQRLLTR